MSGKWNAKKNSNPRGEEDPHVGLINIGLTNVQYCVQRYHKEHFSLLLLSGENSENLILYLLSP